MSGSILDRWLSPPEQDTESILASLMQNQAPQPTMTDVMGGQPIDASGLAGNVRANISQTGEAISNLAKVSSMREQQRLRGIEADTARRSLGQRVLESEREQTRHEDLMGLKRDQLGLARDRLTFLEKTAEGKHGIETKKLELNELALLLKLDKFEQHKLEDERDYAQRVVEHLDNLELDWAKLGVSKERLAQYVIETNRRYKLDKKTQEDTVKQFYETLGQRKTEHEEGVRQFNVGHDLKERKLDLDERKFGADTEHRDRIFDLDERRLGADIDYRDRMASLGEDRLVLDRDKHDYTVAQGIIEENNRLKKIEEDNRAYLLSQALKLTSLEDFDSVEESNKYFNDIAVPHILEQFTSLAGENVSTDDAVSIFRSTDQYLGKSYKDPTSVAITDPETGETMSMDMHNVAGYTRAVESRKTPEDVAGEAVRRQDQTNMILSVSEDFGSDLLKNKSITALKDRSSQLTDLEYAFRLWEDNPFEGSQNLMSQMIAFYQGANQRITDNDVAVWGNSPILLQRWKKRLATYLSGTKFGQDMIQDIASEGIDMARAIAFPINQTYNLNYIIEAHKKMSRFDNPALYPDLDASEIQKYRQDFVDSVIKDLQVNSSVPTITGKVVFITKEVKDKFDLDFIRDGEEKIVGLTSSSSLGNFFINVTKGRIRIEEDESQELLSGKELQELIIHHIFNETQVMKDARRRRKL